MFRTLIAVGLMSISPAQDAPWPGARPPGSDGSPRATPTEACCRPNGNCYDLPADYCLSQGGTPQGPGTACIQGQGLPVMLDGPGSPIFEARLGG